MLKIDNVTKSFGEKIILNDVSFEANPGEIIGLVAPNGTGKSTLLNIIMNFVQPDSGEVSINERFNYQSKKNEIMMHRYLSFLPEMNDLYGELSGMEHLKLYARMWGQSTKRIQTITARLNMDHYVKKAVHTYSLGMKQRLCFAMLLAADTEIMLMDEVMNGLDPDNVSLLTEILIELKQKNKIILIASHLLDNLDLYADRVLFLRHAKITFEDKEHSGESREKKYIKVSLLPVTYKEVSQIKELPENSVYIAEKTLCIPIKDLSEQEISEWVTFFLNRGDFDLTIGEIGTAEWYEEFYNSGK